MGAGVAQGTDTLQDVVLGLHLTIVPARCAVAPQVREGPEVDDLEKHPDGILAGVVGDKVAGILVVRPTFAAPGPEGALDASALLRANRREVISDKRIAVFAVLPAHAQQTHLGEVLDVYGRAYSRLQGP